MTVYNTTYSKHRKRAKNLRNNVTFNSIIFRTKYSIYNTLYKLAYFLFCQNNRTIEIKNKSCDKKKENSKFAHFLKNVFSHHIVFPLKVLNTLFDVNIIKFLFNEIFFIYLNKFPIKVT